MQRADEKRKQNYEHLLEEIEQSNTNELERIAGNRENVTLIFMF